MKPKDLLRIVLAPFSFMFFCITSLRNVLYDIKVIKAYKSGLKVISIGNITWGGTGKTPSVLYIAKLLLENDQKPAILIRGYGDDEYKLFPKLLGDIPVFIGKDRVSSARKAFSKGSIDTLVLDDGFQHRRLKRDLDIVCVDSLDPFGNGLLIPAGILREGLGSLKRADIFLITKSGLVEENNVCEIEENLKRINKEALIVRAGYKLKGLFNLKDDLLVDITALETKRLALLSAIGNPLSFERTISSIGLDFNKHFVFRDHHSYTNGDLKSIETYCLENKIDAVVSTEEDAIKLKPMADKMDVNIYITKIDIEILKHKKEFHDRLTGSFNS